MDFDYAKNVIKVNQACQVGTSLLSSRYLKLYKAHSQSNSIAENIDRLLEFINAHRKLLDKMPSSYSELLHFSIQCQVGPVSNMFFLYNLEAFLIITIGSQYLSMILNIYLKTFSQITYTLQYCVLAL